MEDNRDGGHDHYEVRLCSQERRGGSYHGAAEAGSDTMQAMSRMVYSGSYAMAYGIVYATVFVLQLLPQDNPFMHGFHDGGKAAMDELSRS